MYLGIADGQLINFEPHPDPDPELTVRRFGDRLFLVYQDQPVALGHQFYVMSRGDFRELALNDRNEVQYRGRGTGIIRCVIGGRHIDYDFTV